MASTTFNDDALEAYGLIDAEIASGTSYQPNDHEHVLDPVGYGSMIRATLADFREDRPDLFAGLGMDDELIAQVRYNPIANYVEIPLVKDSAKRESVSAFIVYFWAHSADQAMNRLHFYYVR